MIAAPEDIERIDLECAERMAEVFAREVESLPDNSELKRPMTKARDKWREIAFHIAERSS